MENSLCQYDGEKYSIPYEILGEWNAYMVSLSRFSYDAGNADIAFSDKFSKYKIKNDTPVSNKQTDILYSRKDMIKAIEYGAWFVSYLKGHPSEDDKTDYLDKLHP